MDMELNGRVAVITGGSMGIGYATAERLLAEGTKVVITARNQDRLDAAAESLRSSTGGEVLAVSSDTTRGETITAMVEQVVETFGRLDILVNGAAAPSGLVRNNIQEVDADLLLTDLDTKVVGYFRCAQAVVAHMAANGYGRIINIGGLTGRASHALSGMRNLAVVHMTKALSDQLGPQGITVNTIHPGVIETEHIHDLYAKEAKKQNKTPEQVEQGYIDRTPLRRILEASEVGDLITFLASARAAAITGESIGIDGGITRGIFL